MPNLDEIKKLSPEERIKLLKKLEEEKRKEIAEAESLMKQSVGELENEEKIRQEMPIPQIKAVDIDGLFTQEEKQLFATKRYSDSSLKAEEEPKKKAKPKETTLEDEVWKGAPNIDKGELERQKQYGEKLAMEQPSQLYTLAREAYNEFKETGAVDPSRIYALDVAARVKDESSGGEYKAPTDEAQEQFGSVKSIIKYLRGR